MISDEMKIACLPITFCDLCGRQKAQRVTNRDRYGYPISLLKCACGLYRNSHRPEDLMAFYSGTYRKLVSTYHKRQINELTIQAEQLQYAEWLNAFLYPNRYDEILDMGGSTGVVSDHLAKEWDAVSTVVDPCESELVCAAGERIRSTAEEFEPGERTWDVGLLCQTIEHLLSPAEVLAKMANCCDVLFMDAVDVAQFGDRNQACKIDHLWGFTDQTCRRLLKETKWRVTASQRNVRATPNSVPHLAYLAVRL